MESPFNLKGQAIKKRRSSPNDVEQALFGGFELTGSPPQNHGNEVVNIAKPKAAADHRFDDIVGRLELAG